MGFEPDVWGQPDPALSREDVDRIIDDARRHGQHVYFGDGWKHPQQNAPRLTYASQVPVVHSFAASAASAVASFFGF